MARLLLTGSEGLIGRAARRLLSGMGHAVHGFDLALPEGHPEHGDIRDPARLRRAIEGCDGVLHLAAVARVGEAEADPARCHAVNVEATAGLIDAVAASPRPPWLLFASSREVYGEPARLPVSEDMPIRPINSYGRSKAEAEALIDAAGRRGLTTLILRYANVYGSVHDHPDRVIPAFARASVRGATMHLRGRDNAFDFTHVEDVAHGTALAAQALIAGRGPLPPVHLASGRLTTLEDLARLARAAGGGRAAIREEATVQATVSRFCGDPARAQTLLGWRARIGLEEGVRRMVDGFADLEMERSMVA